MGTLELLTNVGSPAFRSAHFLNVAYLAVQLNAAKPAMSHELLLPNVSFNAAKLVLIRIADS